MLTAGSFVLCRTAPRGHTVIPGIAHDPAKKDTRPDIVVVLSVPPKCSFPNTAANWQPRRLSSRPCLQKVRDDHTRTERRMMPLPVSEYLDSL